MSKRDPIIDWMERHSGIIIIICCVCVLTAALYRFGTVVKWW